MNSRLENLKDLFDEKAEFKRINLNIVKHTKFNFQEEFKDKRKFQEKQKMYHNAGYDSVLCG